MPETSSIHALTHSATLENFASRMSQEKKELIIQGITTKGRAFRPSDWAERLAGIMSTFGGDECLRYSPHVRPIMLDGVRCVWVDPALATAEPRAYRFLLDFAKDNELVVVDPEAPNPDEDVCLMPGVSLRPA